MCGIVGYVGNGSASEILLNGLKRLEYRGYDSSGLAVLADGKLELRRSVGKISNLSLNIKNRPLNGHIGVGHTRWATHGIPSEENAHPHTDCSKRIVVVHNGIIENYSSLKAVLIKKAHQFVSQTDTEIIAHLIEESWELKQKNSNGKKSEEDFLHAVRHALLQCDGAYALGILCMDFPELLVAARKDCPLVLGLGKKENFIASDIPALLGLSKKVIFLDQEEIAVIKKNSIDCFNLQGKKVEKKSVKVKLDPVQAEKANFKHFMLKEIMEQPRTIQDTLRGRVFPEKNRLQLELNLSAAFIKGLKRITLVACGTSYHAALVGRFWLESLAKVPCQVEIASEYRYRDHFFSSQELVIFISQSGETADTLAALRLTHRFPVKTLAICNVLGSSLTQEADTTFYTRCGPEIGVASTKAFTGQLIALLLLAIHLGIIKKHLNLKTIHQILADLLNLPHWVREALTLSNEIEKISKRFLSKNHFLFLGRHTNYPIALEGALKLKEISYIHAEGYPAGEMKHGPIALIDKEMPLVALVTDSLVYEKICSNIEEAKARGGTVIAIASKGNKTIQEKADEVLYVEKVPEIFSSIVNVIPLQLFAYHMADLKGCDVDQPRNLAKSVTVE
ncbi:MAG: glutamine--fructose-6-phosphate aminotransferase [Elusimicrobia bacterium RIFCSPLOWO2_02_FULL_39_32]|nr:MAG: glutamine--fructose-6-phosphate aminotransferase [Elusimicrobia bacterium RIFCSPHIGHO2_02_FULL_39_36]OGR91752.1 MAG: glutamine--fructose-6-phosphate aminotransferase [Elusimicrobia bacterium RIFCSPLOWO2_02_FULL_39_32]OGR98411.1 MAG: glutamine--fructose-6-phosphate aminotransferase [Elusimicrobia bacterium RIFCSPLOWO2_12_FULL_39_28]